MSRHIFSVYVPSRGPRYSKLSSLILKWNGVQETEIVRENSYCSDYLNNDLYHNLKLKQQKIDINKNFAELLFFIFKQCLESCQKPEISMEKVIRSIINFCYFLSFGKTNKKKKKGMNFYEISIFLWNTLYVPNLSAGNLKFPKVKIVFRVPLANGGLERRKKRNCCWIMADGSQLSDRKVFV